MITIENTEIVGWEASIRGCRNPMNSWEKSDSEFIDDPGSGHDILGREISCEYDGVFPGGFVLGNKDHELMTKLVRAGRVDAKYRRMIVVYTDILAPLYWWKEFDTYKVGTVANSCSTMHKIAAKEFTLDDFSCEHLFAMPEYNDIPDFDNDEDLKQYKEKVDEAIALMREGKEHVWPEWVKSAAEREVEWHYKNGAYYAAVDYDPYADATVEWVEVKYALDVLNTTIEVLNYYREKFLVTKDKKYWWQMIQLLPSSYNQRRTVMLNYEVLANMYASRKEHKLDEWRNFCKWIESLPYSEIITLKGE